MEDERETTSLRHRRKKSGMSLSCCFHGHNRRFDTYDSSFSSPDVVDKSSPVLRSPSTWFRSKGHEFPEIKGRCRNFISRMGRPARRHSADFSYDPLSYALNFDEGSSDDARIEDFTARLPVSPPRRRTSEPRIKNLELPSPRGCAGRRSVQSPTEAKVPTIKSIEIPSPPAAAAGRTSVDSSTAASGGRGSVERPPPVSREISVE